MRDFLVRFWCSFRGHGDMEHVAGWPGWYRRCKKCGKILNLH